MKRPEKTEYGWKPPIHHRINPGKWASQEDRHRYEKDLALWKLKQAIDKIRTLINPSTRKTMEALSGDGLNGTDVEIATGQSQSLTSKNLNRLAKFGFVKIEQGEGGDYRYRIFSLTPEIDRVMMLCEELNDK